MNLESLETSNAIKRTVKNIKEYKNRGIGLITFRFSNLDDIQVFSKEIISLSK